MELQETDCGTVNPDKKEMESIFIISPHIDDAALSLGSALLAGSLGKAPRIVSVFSHSNYTIELFSNGDLEVITKMRKAEEKCACQIMRARAEFLDFDEALVRGVVKVDELLKKNFDPIRDPIH